MRGITGGWGARVARDRRRSLAMASQIRWQQIRATVFLALRGFCPGFLITITSCRSLQFGSNIIHHPRQ